MNSADEIVDKIMAMRMFSTNDTMKEAITW